ncbi:hypothetical protein JX265_013357 [Neoarthrinium moseri]|uniref:Uncharacterized protein n=1 Tax=Neoarthrinium moseri TaxID=1658444 RepID=A0A9P9W8V2_9PEZI|nr:uncharacterized protein JN550_012207 [Neoarthrinium moseri]KAI1847232.1 hypothetical protein JX266_006772 [Neoarthrinium moseri]KAI1850794.1 hypothetical protein JX265_013357 [Neoarthrinium moseri]KAI1859194.1 hypothetical protein JN550_012207 [Neoarthrinium moseri]
MSELQDLVAHLGESVQQLAGLVGMAGQRFTTNLTASFTTMTLKHWIRLVMIVGTYLLVRPYIIKLGAKHQEKQFEKAHAEEEEAQAKISPNQLRGQVDVPDDSDDELPEPEATAASTAADWGKKARKRQRNMIKKLIDAEEKRLQELQEDEEDKDIEQYLT